MSFFYQLVCVLFPEHCPYCGCIIDPEQIACEKCRQKLDKRQKPIIRGASGFRCVSSFVYDGSVRRMILRIKYHERVQYLPQVAQILAKDIRTTYPDCRFDCLTSVPMHKKDLFKRVFNQAELLAKELSKLLDIPYEETLVKVKRTKKQHTLNYAKRKNNLNGAFNIIDKERITGKNILIIDDIITSGITLGTCCKVLNRAKPRLLCCATIANANARLPRSAII